MYEWQNLDYLEACGLVIERDPRKFSWGYFSNDISSSIGDGFFMWFESIEELAEFIVKVETEKWSHEDKGKFVEIRKVVQEILIIEADLTKGLTESLRFRINEQLGDGEISWWGEFKDICFGNDEFSRDLVGLFYEDFDEFPEGNSSKTITAEYLEEFVQFCKVIGH